MIRYLRDRSSAFRRRTGPKRKGTYAWAALTPASQVAFTHAHTDPRGVTRGGGVAVFVPHRTQIISQRVLAPGCAVECYTDCGEEGTRAFWSVYLPPGSQGSTLTLLWHARPPANPTLVIAGDFNIEIARPRIEEERGLRDKLLAWFARLGVAPVRGSGHTRRERKGKACIDPIAVPEGQAWRWRVARTRRSDLSDHARLQVVAGNRASVGRSCTPAAMRSLPVAALVDLRRIFTHVGLVLGSHAHGRPVGRARAPTVTDRPPRPGDLAALHPASGIACEGGCRSPCSACAPQAEGARGQWKFCAPSSDRRRARGTLRATAGAEGPRTRGEATSGRGDCHGRTDGLAHHPSTTGGGGGPPPGGEVHGQGHEGRAEHDYVWDPVRALFIGPFIEHAIRGWWRRHRGGARETCAISEELRRIAGCGGHRTVSTAFREWIRGHGEDADTISSAQAFRWLTCTEHARRCARMSELSLDKRGPSSRRPAVAEKYRVGRAIHKAFNRMQGLRGDDGQMIQDPARVDQMLWDSRKELSGSAPPMLEFADTILEAYFRDRSASLPDVPRPSSRDIAGAGHVLAAGGSAPGHNGIPYEAYHQGAELVTEALALAVLAAHHDPAVLDTMLGPNMDLLLLLWIPKKAGADRPDGQRPLHLPTCFRRLFGSVITSMVAPQVEPRSSEWQVSVKGGSCARNITSAFEHLGGFDEPVHSPAGTLWKGVLGDAAEGAEAACVHAGKSNLRACPAVVLADQSKAFERMGMAWLRKVMDGWKFTGWVREAFDSLLRARGVRACIGGVPGYVRMLAGGLGMGNTPGPFF